MEIREIYFIDITLGFTLNVAKKKLFNSLEFRFTNISDKNKTNFLATEKDKTEKWRKYISTKSKLLFVRT